MIATLEFLGMTKSIEVPSGTGHYKVALPVELTPALIIDRTEEPPAIQSQYLCLVFRLDPERGPERVFVFDHVEKGG
jgi:hypothetical protein